MIDPLISFFCRLCHLHTYQDEGNILEPSPVSGDTLAAWKTFGRASSRMALTPSKKCRSMNWKSKQMSFSPADPAWLNPQLIETQMNQLEHFLEKHGLSLI
ncbi:MAG TPA: hypothetical protein VIS71_08750 [Terrimicrobium sp.]